MKTNMVHAAAQCEKKYDFRKESNFVEQKKKRKKEKKDENVL